MGWIFLKRAARDLKAGWARYIALSLLIIFSIFIVTSLMGAAVTVIDTTKNSDVALCCEDGEFSCFVPLRESELKKIEDKGVEIEEMFYADYEINEEQTLRVFKIREHINKIALVEGNLPANDNEAVIERRFAEVNNVTVGSVIKIGDKEFTVSGIGAVPDYNSVIKKFSDSVVDSKAFGLLFVTPDAYDVLYRSGYSESSEEFYYAYLLHGAMSEDELKDILEDIDFDVEDVDDEYFREYWDRMVGRKDDLLEGIDELKDGASELADGAEELSDGIGEFHDGMTELHDAVPDLTDGIAALDDGASELEDGIKAYTDGVSSVASGTSELSDGASELAVGYAQIQSGIDGVNTGAGALRDGAYQLYNGVKTLNDNSKTLRDGASALHDGTSELREGAEELADGIDELYDGSVEINDGAKDLADGARELSDGVNEFSDEANDLIDEVFNIETSNLMLFINHNDNPRIGAAADDVEINYSASIIFGVLLVMLFAYVISVFIVHTIDQESSVIGALYSMGVKRRTLTLSYVAVPVIVTFISGVIGTAIALYTPAGIPAQLQDTLGYYSMPEMEIIITPFIMIYGLIVPPLTAFIVNVLVIRNRLKKTPLALLKNEQKAVRGKELKIKGLSFISMFRIRQMLREIRAGLTVILGMFMALLVGFLALNTLVYCNKVKDYNVSLTKYEYMYNYKYPTEEVPEGGYEAVSETLSKEIYGYSFDVMVMGITKDNPFFDTGDLPDNDTDVVISSAVANKYNLKTGDVFTLSGDNGDRLYAFRVARIVDYTASLTVFMDIEKCRDLFGEDDDYFNVVFSDHELDIDSGRLYATVSKKDIEKAAGIYVDMMGPMVVTISVASSVIFLVVMYLMIKMMIDRSSFNISLVKIFGFRNREVRRMYLDGNFFTVVLGALVVIPVCKMIMDYVYPRYLVSNVGVGIRPDYPPELYAAIFAVIIGLYLVINFVLTSRIKKINPALVLKNRE